MLSRSDLEALLSDPVPERQAAAVTRVATAWRAGRLDEETRVATEQLFRMVARKATVAVRGALSRAVQDADDLPHDVAIKLASDVDHVALPLLEASNVLTDDDLVALIRAATPGAMYAIAGRPAVSGPVADALVEQGDARSVGRLVGNPGASLSDQALERAAERHGDSALVAEPLAARPALPPQVAERLMAVVAEQLRQHLLSRDAIAPDLLTDLVLQSRERATLGLPHGVGQDLEGFIESLDRSGRLTPTLMMRALLTGDYLFFESAMARRAGIPAANAHQLLNDPGGQGIARLFIAAGMPEEQLPLARVAMIAAEETELRDEPGAKQHYRDLVVARILTGFGDRVDTDSLDYMITKIGRGSAAVA